MLLLEILGVRVAHLGCLLFLRQAQALKTYANPLQICLTSAVICKGFESKIPIQRNNSKTAYVGTRILTNNVYKITFVHILGFACRLDR